MDLVFYPAPVLKRRATLIESVDAGVHERARGMFEIMYRERGVGLAAPQVGWSARLFVINPTGEPDPALERVYINPEIRLAEGETIDEEGCLSIPGVRGKVARSERVVVRALGLDGQVFEEDVNGIHARAIQHELDHLDGILFITRLNATDRMAAGRPLKELEKKYKEDLKIAGKLPPRPSRGAAR